MAGQSVTPKDLLVAAQQTPLAPRTLAVGVNTVCKCSHQSSTIGKVKPVHYLRNNNMLFRF